MSRRDHLPTRYLQEGRVWACWRFFLADILLRAFDLADLWNTPFVEDGATAVSDGPLETNDRLNKQKVLAKNKKNLAQSNCSKEFWV